MNDSLNPLQAIISNALTEMNEKSLITEANLARKVRMLAKIETKNKAGVCLNDLEKAVDSLESQGNIKYSIHLNSANEYMIKKSEVSVRLESEARHRRITAEKSMSILTLSDLDSKKSVKGPKQKNRTESRKISIYSNFEDIDD